MMTLKKSLVVEAALAGLFAAVVAAPALAEAQAEKPMKHSAKRSKGMSKKEAMAKVHCWGVNACKGTSECAVPGKNECAGANACKGQGWITLAKKTCLKKKGTLEAPKTEAAPAMSGEESGS